MIGHGLGSEFPQVMVRVTDGKLGLQGRFRGQFESVGIAGGHDSLRGHQVTGGRERSAPEGDRQSAAAIVAPPRVRTARSGPAVKARRRRCDAESSRTPPHRSARPSEPFWSTRSRTRCRRCGTRCDRRRTGAPRPRSRGDRRSCNPHTPSSGDSVPRAALPWACRADSGGPCARPRRAGCPQGCV